MGIDIKICIQKLPKYKHFRHSVRTIGSERELDNKKAENLVIRT